MIEITELRIGNLFHNKFMEVVSINGISLPKSEGYVSIIQLSNQPYGFKSFLIDITPIPLTEEWLKNDIYIESEYQQCHIRFEKDEDGKTYAVLRDIDEQQLGTKKYFLHELQNLHFALTGEELTIKETV